MSSIKSEFPPIRACIFDMDGLLLNTEDIYTLCANKVLARHGRPNLPWSVKAKLMGVPAGSTGDSFHEWANLPIPREQYKLEQFEEHKKHFPECMPLPGAEALLAHLSTARNVVGGKVEVALATSSARQNFNLKIRRPESVRLMSHIPEGRRILGDDPRVKQGCGKPAPDIYLLALETINASLEEGVPRISPNECLVFEDSIPGVEAGRRAGMRVVWVPHKALANELKGKEKEVLAGRVGLVRIGDEQQLGQLDDGWAEQLPSLVDFPYDRYGIVS